MAIIIGVCCGFLLLMVALGWVRIRAAHQPVATEEIQDAEMAWDDSALNITVNPMEVCLILTDTCRFIRISVSFASSKDQGLFVF